MRDVTVRCCRCGHIIERAGSVLEASAGPLKRRRSTPYDLCEPCGRAFVEWMRLPELPTLEPTGPRLETIGSVDSMAVSWCGDGLNRPA